jgi:hypothetical protein
MPSFWSNFGKGFVQGWDGAKNVMDKIPVVNVISKELPQLSRLHKGGKVPKTGEFRLSGGELVLNKTQQTRLKNAKTTKTKNKIIADVARRTPKKTKAMMRKKK